MRSTSLSILIAASSLSILLRNPKTTPPPSRPSPAQNPPLCLPPQTDRVSQHSHRPLWTAVLWAARVRQRDPQDNHPHGTQHIYEILKTTRTTTTTTTLVISTRIHRTIASTQETTAHHVVVYPTSPRIIRTRL